MENGNIEGCMMRRKLPGDPGWQIVDGHGNLCGQASAWTLFRAMGYQISIYDVITKYQELADPKTEGDYKTSGAELARFINLGYSEYAHAWYEKWNQWTYAAHWGGQDFPEEDVMDLLRNKWFGWDTYVFAMIKINTSWKGKGRLSWGVPNEIFGGDPRERFSDHYIIPDDDPKTDDSILHWVIITGVSLEWDYPCENRWFDPWQWVRVFNPWRGISEYYWFRDFSSSWTGSMVRVDPADSKHTCSINQWGECK